ncbi:hypothetical protein BH10PAT1_BH10PAT1_2360 [soil metagenome]
MHGKFILNQVMDSDLAQEAINAALSSAWKQAVILNLKIIKLNPKDVDALNRIAKAHAECGEINKANAATQKVLKIDPANTIAIKAIQKWKDYKSDGNISSTIISANSFIEEPTRTRIVKLINLGETNNINNLDCGDALKMSGHIHRVNVYTKDEKYIGRFPDDIAAKFISLIKLGGTYEVLVKSSSKTHVEVFVRALTRNGF